MEKPRFRPTKAEVDHFRIRLVNLTTQQETFTCFPSQREASHWLMQQAKGTQAELSLVFGPDCFYCRKEV